MGGGHRGATTASTAKIRGSMPAVAKRQGVGGQFPEQALEARGDVYQPDAVEVPGDVKADIKAPEDPGGPIFTEGTEAVGQKRGGGRVSHYKV